MDPKAPWLSKTLWTNVMMAVAAMVPAVQSYVSAHPMVFTMGFAAVNFLLRLVTKNAVGLND